MYKYPYGDSQQLNLDWILAKLKELEASGGSGGADLEDVSNALISLTYNTSTAYRRYDYAFLNGKLYRCLSDTSGVFDPSAWQEALIGDDLSVLTRWINAIDAAAVVDVKFDTSGTNGKIQQKYHDQYHDVVEVDYTPVQNSKRPLSSNAGYELNGAIGDVQGQITVHAQANTTANRAYKINEYFELNGTLYRVTADIANGGTITVGTNAVATTIEEESFLTLPITFDRSYLFPVMTSIANNKRIRFCIPLQKPIKGWAKGTNKNLTLTINNVGNTTLRVLRAADSAIYSVSQSDIDSFGAFYNDMGLGCQLDVKTNIFTNTGVAYTNFPDNWTINFA